MLGKFCSNCLPRDPNDGLRGAGPHVCLNDQCDCEKADMHYEPLPTQSRVQKRS